MLEPTPVSYMLEPTSVSPHGSADTAGRRALPLKGERGGGSYGLIGHPLGHSFSARFFAEKFEREGIEATYRNFDLEDISEVEQLRSLDGFNVTIPYKQAIMPYLAGISDEAREIGAVNTVKVVDGQFYGYNTDVIGFRQSLERFLKEYQQRTAAGGQSLTLQALVLGTGGASKAVCYALTQLGIPYYYISRTPKAGQFTYADLPTLLQPSSELFSEPSSLLIVNCSPLGTYPQVDTCPDIPYHLLTPRILLYDLVYNPEETLFLRKGREKGCPIKNGLEMLHGQAIAAWQIWTTKN